jgi:hypothetical protein
MAFYFTKRMDDCMSASTLTTIPATLYNTSWATSSYTVPTSTVTTTSTTPTNDQTAVIAQIKELLIRLFALLNTNNSTPTTTPTTPVAVDPASLQPTVTAQNDYINAVTQRDLRSQEYDQYRYLPDNTTGKQSALQALNTAKTLVTQQRTNRDAQFNALNIDQRRALVAQIGNNNRAEIPAQQQVLFAAQQAFNNTQPNITSLENQLNLVTQTTGLNSTQGLALQAQLATARDARDEARGRMDAAEATLQDMQLTPSSELLTNDLGRTSDSAAKNYASIVDDYMQRLHKMDLQIDKQETAINTLSRRNPRDRNLNSMRDALRALERSRKNLSNELTNITRNSGQDDA